MHQPSDIMSIGRKIVIKRMTNGFLELFEILMSLGFLRPVGIALHSTQSLQNGPKAYDGDHVG